MRCLLISLEHSSLTFVVTENLHRRFGVRIVSRFETKFRHACEVFHWRKSSSDTSAALTEFTEELVEKPNEIAQGQIVISD